MLCYTLPQYDVMLLPVMMLLNMYLAGFVRYGIMAMAYYRYWYGISMVTRPGQGQVREFCNGILIEKKKEEKKKANFFEKEDFYSDKTKTKTDFHQFKAIYHGNTVQFSI